MIIEPGMYVRTYDGKIGKQETKVSKNCTAMYRNSVVVAASFDLIDLIVAGDYVNGYLVVGIEKDNLGDLYVQVGHISNNEYKDVWVDNTIDLKDIKEILTKEQYEANVYKKGDK